MAVRELVRGDSYTHRRPVFRFTLADIRGKALDLTGYTIRATFKSRQTSLEDDPLDVFAPIRHELVIDEYGVPQKENGLVLDGPVESGRIAEYLTSDETRVLPLRVELFGDIELTDPTGAVFSYILEDRLYAIDGYTHRSHQK